MSLTDIYRPIQSQMQATEAVILKELSSRQGLMAEMTRHVARMPGKRVRPALALLGACVVDGSTNGHHAEITEKAVRLAAAVEMIHTATLLHDDVIDGASLRRGLTTLNAKWGDTLSILSGDYLYSKAFCLLSGLGDRVLKLMAETAHTVCEGEVAQIQHQYDLNLSRKEYLKIIKWKTASLMGAAAQGGAMLAGATDAQARRLGIFGESFGLAFQIMDDTQDLVGDQVVQAKTLGTDLALGQLTLPLLYLKDNAEQETRTALSEWFTNGGDGGTRTAEETTERLALLKEEAIRYQVPAYCRRIAGRYLTRARTALAPFPNSPYKTSLHSLTDFLVRTV